MREIEKIAETLFEKIRSRFENVNIGDENAKATQDPEKARFFNFDYVTKDGTNFGNVTVSLIDEDSIKVYYSKNIVDGLDESHKDEWFGFLRGIRKFAKRNLLSFDTRDIAKSNLQVKDLKQQSKADATFSQSDLSVTESKLYGTSLSSYQECGPTRIIVRHNQHVDEEKRGSRTRNIEAVFVETHLGERFLLPFKNLHGARAMAQHMSQGGRMDDELGEGVCGMVSEMNSMAHFVREARRRQFEDSETDAMAKSAVQRYEELKRQLHHISGRRGYEHYKETYMPEGDIEETIDVNDLRERFVKKIYNDKFDEALPYVYRAYLKQKNKQETPMAEEFESWADEVVEGTWEMPDTEDQAFRLGKILSQPLEVGSNGDNAIGALADVIGDDQLSDQLAQLAKDQGPEADARPLVTDWLNRYMPDLAAELRTGAVRQPESSNQYGGTTMDEPVNHPHAESADPLDFIRSLAGLRK